MVHSRVRVRVQGYVLRSERNERKTGEPCSSHVFDRSASLIHYHTRHNILVIIGVELDESQSNGRLELDRYVLQSACGSLVSRVRTMLDTTLTPTHLMRLL